MLNSQTTGAEGSEFQGLKKRRPSAWGMGRRIELVESHPVARG
jgi:hypothetical protein